MSKKTSGVKLKRRKRLILVLICIFIFGLIGVFIGSKVIYRVYANKAEIAVSRAYMACYISVNDPEGTYDNVDPIELVEEGPVEEDTYEEVVEEYVEPVKVVETFESGAYETRMTSFWADDGSGTGECTGSGLCSWDFGVDEHGWYTWNGKLVVATATTYLANQGWTVADGVHLYKYYEELVLTIDGVEYDAIILDSCGSSMKTDRVDLFVSGGWAVKDTMIQVRRK